MDYSRRIKPCVESEIGKLNYVLLHAPGHEIEHMTPENAHKFLFSDMLNQREAYNDYKDFQGTLRKVANVLTVRELLEDILKDQQLKFELIEKICKREDLEFSFMNYQSISSSKSSAKSSMSFSNVSTVSLKSFS